jgi:hypothetical protein
MRIGDIQKLFYLIEQYNLEVKLPNNKVAKRNIAGNIDIGGEEIFRSNLSKSSEVEKLKELKYWTTQNGNIYAYNQLSINHIEKIIIMLKAKNPNSPHINNMEGYLKKIKRSENLNKIFKKLD